MAQHRQNVRFAIEHRFWSKVHMTDTCWLWTGTLASNGYGVFKVSGKVVKAHRYARQLLGLPLDEHTHHSCENKHCVNPAHTEPLTAREHVFKGDNFVAKAARQTHCIHGHEYTPENTYTTGNPPGRRCRTCRDNAYWGR